MPEELKSKYLYTEDALGIQQSYGTIVQRGSYILASGKADITFRVPYLTTSAAPVSAISILITPRSATQFQYVQSIGLGSALPNGATPVSSFTVSGSGTELGYYCVMGYR